MTDLDIIICGNSLDVLKNMDDFSVDMIITSPPYNFNKSYDNHNDKESFEEYSESFLFPILKECYRILKHTGRMAINIQPLYINSIPTHHIITDYLRSSLEMIWRNEIIWNKSNFSKLTAWGSWKSPSCPYINYPYEFIEVFSKGDIKKEGKKENIDITKEEFVEYVNGIWTFAPEINMKKFGHPAMFPEELPYRLLKLFTYKGDIILDPFSGCGTTSLVAYKLDRHYIGIDISGNYCNIAKNRLKEAKYDKENLENFLY